MAEVYKIGVEIALAGTIMQGLEALSAKLLGIKTKVSEVEGGFARWSSAIYGAAAIFTGGAMLEGMKKVVDAGGDLVKQQALLRAMGGMSAADITGATNAAQLATQQVMGTTIAENLKGIRELVGVMPSLKEAQEAYPEVMKAAKVLESVSGTPASDSLQTIAKAIELRGGGMNAKTGQLDPQRFIQEAQAAQAAITASGGLVNAAALLQYMKTAGPMARMMSDPDVFYSQALTAIMDMGGFRAGTAMTASGRQLLGGKMGKPTAEEMQSLGLLKEGMWHGSGTGVYVDKGGLEGEDILKDPKQGMLDWANKILIPALAAKGITASADVQQELYKVFGTETARRMMGLFIQNQSQIAKESRLHYTAHYGANAPPPSAYGYSAVTGGYAGAYAAISQGDLGANVKNLQDAVQSFLQAFGAPIVPIAIEALQKVSSAINEMAAVALAHPAAMKGIGEGLIAISAGLVVLGGAAVVGAMAMLAPGGAVVGGLMALAAAGAALAAINWAFISSGLSAIASALAALPGAIAGIPGKLKDAISSMFGGAGAASGPTIPPGRDVHSPSTGPYRYDRQSSNTPTIHNRTVVMLDGRVLGEAVSSELANASTFPRQAAANDTYVGWNAPDSNFSMA
jgi:hypothetical protein